MNTFNFAEVNQKEQLRSTLQRWLANLEAGDVEIFAVSIPDQSLNLETQKVNCTLNFLTNIEFLKEKKAK